VVLTAGPDVFNHNVETTEALTPRIRNRADYRRSLDVLAFAARTGHESMLVKSGFMLGMGEDDADVHRTLADLRDCGVDVLTIGQYLPPSSSHWPLERYVTPEEFARWEQVALRDYGFGYVVSGPLVRSSYKAGEAVAAVRQNSSRRDSRHSAADQRHPVKESADKD
jgi:lipoic acid synthetase